MNITIEDLKRLSEIYEPIIERADELLMFQSKINGKHKFYVDSISEITDKTIEFYCYNYRDNTEHIAFTLEDFVSDDYLNLYKKQYEEILEQERIEKEAIEKHRQAKIEEQELATLRRLKEKYPDQD